MLRTALLLGHGELARVAEAGGGARSGRRKGRHDGNWFGDLEKRYYGVTIAGGLGGYMGWTGSTRQTRLGSGVGKA